MLYTAEYTLSANISQEHKKSIYNNEIAIQIGRKIVKDIPLKAEKVRNGEFDEELHTMRIHVFTDEEIRQIAMDINCLTDYPNIRHQITKVIQMLLP